MNIECRFVLLQISTLVEHRSGSGTCGAGGGGAGGGGGGGGGLRANAVARVGQAVNLAVERFVTVGETIADDYHEVKQGMYEACKEARQAGMYQEKRCLRTKYISRTVFTICVPDQSLQVMVELSENVEVLLHITVWQGRTFLEYGFNNEWFNVCRDLKHPTFLKQLTWGMNRYVPICTATNSTAPVSFEIWTVHHIDKLGMEQITYLSMVLTNV